MEFVYDSDDKEGYVLVTMSGNLMEKNSAVPLLNMIHDRSSRGDNRYILDLSDLKYMNSSGINVLINILTRARNHGGEVVITGLSPKINSLLVVTKLNSVFKVADTVKEAEEMLKE
jgi:anti-sigma B factor antagonist